MERAIALVESGVIPDWITRWGIRRVVKERLCEEFLPDTEQVIERFQHFLKQLGAQPLAIETAEANRQHYEVPAEFFQLVLGKNLKYSSCYFPNGNESLSEGEDVMLALTCQRAQLEDGHTILELGCGWGSLTLWMARNYPRSQILAVSNSASQAEFIRSRASQQGLPNITVVTQDVNLLELEQRFDRIVSVEMFEHLKNYDLLLSRVKSWLKPSGKLFVHIFCHREYAYNYETNGSTNWMGRNFFTGGTMPSDHLLLYFPQHVAIDQHWRVNGRHYARTAWLWYENLIANAPAVLELFAKTYGAAEAKIWFNRWKVFFLACHELFAFNNGNEWFVSHYLFSRAK